MMIDFCGPPTLWNGWRFELGIGLAVLLFDLAMSMTQALIRPDERCS